jgi:HPt (histidine-containing phosphotransfer) domain-containing protein
VIDDAVFDRLVDDLGAEHIERVCRMFLANAATAIAALAAALAAANAAEVAEVTHRLKSSSGFLGARRLFVLCADIEGRARADGFEGTPRVKDLLAGELELASVELVRRVGCPLTPDRPGS